MAVIKQVWAREILDSRGIPTVETALKLDTGAIFVSSVPAGTSKGSEEALELRDNDQTRYLGNGVLTAVKNVNEIIAPALVGANPIEQFEIDKKLNSLDGTENKTKLGANAILSVSMVVAKAGASANGMALYKWVKVLAESLGITSSLKLPTPLVNMINGGLHGAGNLDFQEFWVIPASSKAYKDSLRMAAEIYQTVGENLARRGAIHSVGHEGGYAPNLFTNADAFEIYLESIRQTKYDLGRDVFLGLDLAANSFYKNGEYIIKDKSAPLSDAALLEYYKSLVGQYKLAILEDPYEENAWEAWRTLTTELSGSALIVGDDLLVTNPKRVKKAIDTKACNSAVVKPNQIGTVTETLEVVKLVRDASWKIIVSHRSGETNDSFLADFAVGIGAEYAKFGAPARGERVAKYNRLLTIEEEMSRS